MNPVRLYLILSLFYFFVFTQAGQIMTKGDESEINSGKLDKIEGLPGAVQRELNQVLDSASIHRINAQMGESTLADFYANLSEEEREKVYPLLAKAGIDSSAIVKPKKTRIAGNDKTAFSITTDNEAFILSRIDFEKLNSLAEKNLPDKVIYDSLNVGQVSFMEELLVKQIIRIKKADKDVLVGYVLKNVPVMMLLLLPLFALILKVLYVRRKILYIDHLVHAIHLHCFAYFIYGISLIFSLWVFEDVVATLVNIVAFILVTLYAFKSFLVVYHQHWFKTLIKFILTGSLYGVLVLIFFLAETTISILLF